MKLHAGTVDVTLRCTLPRAGSAHVRRVAAIGVPRPLKLLQPLPVRAFRAGSRRTLLALTACADTLL